MLIALDQDTLFLEGADCLSAEDHGDFLTVEVKSLFLKIWFKDTISAT